MKGFAGKILHVDLSSGTFEVQEPGEELYRQYVGGACLGAYYLMKLMPAKADPLGPENVLVFAISGVVGAPISGSGRHCVTAKSPQTGGIASSEAGGFWGAELRFAGFDAVVVRGRSAAPVYLWIHDGQYELRDASHLWGRSTGEAQDAIRAELGDARIRVAQIGPAGEKGVLFANIANELKHFNGRAGLGAVMGSKKLRAVAVRGTTKPEYADVELIRTMAKQYARKVQGEGFLNVFRRYGTTLNVTWNSDLGGLPTKNWTMGTWPEGRNLISAETYADTMMDRSGTCFACAQACKRDVKSGIEKPWAIEARYGGPEYETIGMVGSNCMVGDLKAISKANEIASKYGADTISLGGVLGFVMECFERGILTEKDTGGMKLTFGNGRELVAAAEAVCRREGFGDRMAEGIARLAASLGPEAERIAVTVKGKEFPAHMPTAKGAMTLIYAVNPFGPDHVSCNHDGDIVGEPNEANKAIGVYMKNVPSHELNFDKVQYTLYTQRAISAVDSWSVCQFIFNTWSAGDFGDLVKLVQAATGWSYSIQELMLLGERRINLMKAFNVREGFTAADDMLPERMFSDGMQDKGPRAGAVVDRANFLKAREIYYRLSGWDPRTGIPEWTKMAELGLRWAAELAGITDSDNQAIGAA
jgi:aldehyde:ferredoxin oxidoreductase